MTEIEYRTSEGISRSELWRLRESPEKFLWYREHPEEPTPALVFGALVHKLVLEPETFEDEYAVGPEVNNRTKDGKAEWQAFEDGAGDKIAVKPADYEKAKAMADKVKDTPFVNKLLAGEHEKPIVWTDDLTGELCKVRLDCLSTVAGDPVIVDYKTAADASTEAFIRAAINYGYDFQAAMYCEAVKQTTGKNPRFVFIVQEKTEPYAVNILEADELLVKHGYDVFRELLGIYHECKETGVWWGYMWSRAEKKNAVNNLFLPAWLAKEAE